MTVSRVIYQASTTLQLLVKVRKHRLSHVPHRCPDLIVTMEQYLPTLKTTKVI